MTRDTLITPLSKTLYVGLMGEGIGCFVTSHGQLLLWIWEFQHIPQECLQVRGSKSLGCHADLYTVSRCRTRGESEDHTSKKARKGSTLALKPRADVTRSPKQGYQWPHGKDLCPQKKKKKKEWALLIGQLWIWKFLSSRIGTFHGQLWIWIWMRPIWTYIQGAPRL